MTGLSEDVMCRFFCGWQGRGAVAMVADVPPAGAYFCACAKNCCCTRGDWPAPMCVGVSKPWLDGDVPKLWDNACAGMLGLWLLPGPDR